MTRRWAAPDTKRPLKVKSERCVLERACAGQVQRNRRREGGPLTILSLGRKDGFLAVPDREGWWLLLLGTQQGDRASQGDADEDGRASDGEGERERERGGR